MVILSPHWTEKSLRKFRDWETVSTTIYKQTIPTKSGLLLYTMVAICIRLQNYSRVLVSTLLSELIMLYSVLRPKTCISKYDDTGIY